MAPSASFDLSILSALATVPLTLCTAGHTFYFRYIASTLKAAIISDQHVIHFTRLYSRHCLSGAGRAGPAVGHSTSYHLLLPNGRTASGLSTSYHLTLPNDP